MWLRPFESYTTFKTGLVMHKKDRLFGTGAVAHNLHYNGSVVDGLRHCFDIVVDELRHCFDGVVDRLRHYFDGVADALRHCLTSRKMEAGGTPKTQQKKKQLKKIGHPSNSAVSFFEILLENGSQDGGPNP